MSITSACGGSEDCMSDTCSDHGPKRRVLELEQQIKQLKEERDIAEKRNSIYFKEVKELEQTIYEQNISSLQLNKVISEVRIQFNEINKIVDAK